MRPEWMEKTIFARSENAKFCPGFPDENQLQQCTIHVWASYSNRVIDSFHSNGYFIGWMKLSGGQLPYFICPFFRRLLFLMANIFKWVFSLFVRLHIHSSFGDVHYFDGVQSCAMPFSWKIWIMRNGKRFFWATSFGRNEPLIYLWRAAEKKCIICFSLKFFFWLAQM